MTLHEKLFPPQQGSHKIASLRVPLHSNQKGLDLITQLIMLERMSLYGRINPNLMLTLSLTHLKQSVLIILGVIKVVPFFSQRSYLLCLISYTKSQSIQRYQRFLTWPPTIRIMEIGHITQKTKIMSKVAKRCLLPRRIGY